MTKPKSRKRPEKNRLLPTPRTISVKPSQQLREENQKDKRLYLGKDFDAAEKEELLTNLDRVLPPVMNLAVPEKGKQPGTTVDTMPCTMDNIPSAAQIYKSSKMKTNVERFWRTNATGTYALFLALKNGWLEEEEDEFGTKIISTANVQATSPIIDIMFKSVRKLRGVDFSSLTKSRLDYASQKEIAHSRVILLSACAVHFDLDFGLMVRFLRNEYTSPHRDEKKLEEDVSAHVSEADMKQMIRVLTSGCPHDLDYELPHEEKQKRIKLPAMDPPMGKKEVSQIRLLARDVTVLSIFDLLSA